MGKKRLWSDSPPLLTAEHSWPSSNELASQGCLWCSGNFSLGKYLDPVQLSKEAGGTETAQRNVLS